MKTAALSSLKFECSCVDATKHGFIDVKEDQLASVYIHERIFAEHKLRKGEPVGIFVFNGPDATVPFGFALANIFSFADTETECGFLYNCSPSSLEYKEERLELSSKQQIVLPPVYYITIIPTRLWRSALCYFERILISFPTHPHKYLSGKLMLAEKRFRELFFEKVISAVISRDSPPYFKGQHLEINYHLKRFRMVVLSLYPSAISQAPAFEFKPCVDRWQRLLFSFVNSKDTFYYPSPTSVVIFNEQNDGMLNQCSPLYFKGDPCIASGVSRDKFNEFLSAINFEATSSAHNTHRKSIFIIEGHPGSGKELILHKVIQSLNIPFIASISCSGWSSNQDLEEIRILLSRTLRLCITNRPSIVKIMDFSSSTIHPDVWLLFKEQFLEKIEQQPQILALCIGGFSDFDCIASNLSNHHLLSCYQIASFSQRLEICELLLSFYDADKKQYSKCIAEHTSGYLYKDLCKVIEFSFGPPIDHDSIASLAVRFESSGFETMPKENENMPHQINEALKLIPPSLTHQVNVPRISWEEIGGREHIKQLLKEAVEWPMKFPERFARFGIHPPKGILLYGPPGNSKTLLVKAIASQCKMNFIAIKGPQLLNKWVGESEKALKRVFKLARDHSPTILFFDEIDAIGGKRGADGTSASSGLGDRLLTQLLVELDGFSPLKDTVFIAATNRPDILDPALVRPGRIDRHIFIDLPDTLERMKIFQIQAKKMAFDNESILDELASKTEGYSAAELVAICQRAGMLALESDLNCAKIMNEHLTAALDQIKPMTDPQLVEFYRSFSFERQY